MPEPSISSGSRLPFARIVQSVSGEVSGWPAAALGPAEASEVGATLLTALTPLR